MNQSNLSNLDRLASHYNALGFGIVPVNRDVVHYTAGDGKQHICFLAYNPEFDVVIGEITEAKIVFVKAKQEQYPQMETK